MTTDKDWQIYLLLALVIFGLGTFFSWQIARVDRIVAEVIERANGR